MARELVDLSKFDLTQDVMEDEEIRAMVPHDHEFRMLDGICHLDVEAGLIIGYKDGNHSLRLHPRSGIRKRFRARTVVQAGAEPGSDLMPMRR